MTNDEAPMTNEPEGTKGGNGGRRYDLSERTALFGEAVIHFARAIRLDAVTSPLVRQMVRAATSVGANYDEADEAQSKKEFRYRIGICKKEARESKRWFRMIVAAVPGIAPDARCLWKEAHELHLIFASIFRNAIPPGDQC